MERVGTQDRSHRRNALANVTIPARWLSSHAVRGAYPAGSDQDGDGDGLGAGFCDGDGEGDAAGDGDGLAPADGLALGLAAAALGDGDGELADDELVTGEALPGLVEGACDANGAAAGDDPWRGTTASSTAAGPGTVPLSLGWIGW